MLINLLPYVAFCRYAVVPGCLVYKIGKYSSIYLFYLIYLFVYFVSPLKGGSQDQHLGFSETFFLSPLPLSLRREDYRGGVSRTLRSVPFGLLLWVAGNTVVVVLKPPPQLFSLINLLFKLTEHSKVVIITIFVLNQAEK